MSALTVSLLSGRGVGTKSRSSNDSSSSVSMRKHYQRRNSLHHPTTTKNHHPRATPDRNWIKNNNKNSANNIQKSSKARSNSPSFGGSSVLEDFDGQKPEIATTTRRSSTVNNPLRESKSRAENAMRARQFFNNKQSSSYANGGSGIWEHGSRGRRSEHERATRITTTTTTTTTTRKTRKRRANVRHQEAHDGGV